MGFPGRTAIFFACVPPRPRAHLMVRVNAAHTRSILLLVAAALCWSLGGLLIKSVPWPPLAVAGGRGLIAALFLAATNRGCVSIFRATSCSARPATPPAP
jgi:hypothetical protein